MITKGGFIFGSSYFCENYNRRMFVSGFNVKMKPLLCLSCELCVYFNVVNQIML